MSKLTIWDLADQTGQPLATVIHQAVHVGAWQPNGVIGADWAETLIPILSGGDPWRAPVAPKPANPRRIAEAFLADPDRPLDLNDDTMAARLVELGLAHNDNGVLLGAIESVPEWNRIASGELQLPA